MINIGLWRSTNIILLACDSNLNLFTTALSIGLSTVHLRPFVTLVTSSVSIITSSIPFFITPIFLIHHTVVSFDATVASFDSSLLPSPSPSTLPSSHPVSSPSHPPSPSHFSPSIISVICFSPTYLQSILIILLSSLTTLVISSIATFVLPQRLPTPIMDQIHLSLSWPHIFLD